MARTSSQELIEEPFRPYARPIPLPKIEAIIELLECEQRESRLPDAMEQLAFLKFYKTNGANPNYSASDEGRNYAALIVRSLFSLARWEPQMDDALRAIDPDLIPKNMRMVVPNSLREDQLNWLQQEFCNSSKPYSRGDEATLSFKAMEALVQYQRELIKPEPAGTKAKTMAIKKVGKLGEAAAEALKRTVAGDKEKLAVLEPFLTALAPTHERGHG